MPARAPAQKEAANEVGTGMFGGYIRCGATNTDVMARERVTWRGGVLFVMQCWRTANATLEEENPITSAVSKFTFYFIVRTDRQ